MNGGDGAGGVGGQIGLSKVRYRPTDYGGFSVVFLYFLHSVWGGGKKEEREDGGGSLVVEHSMTLCGRTKYYRYYCTYLFHVHVQNTPLRGMGFVYRRVLGDYRKQKWTRRYLHRPPCLYSFNGSS